MKESSQGGQVRKRQRKEELKELGAGLNLKIKMVRKVEAPAARYPEKEVERPVEEEEIEVTP